MGAAAGAGKSSDGGGAAGEGSGLFPWMAALPTGEMSLEAGEPFPEAEVSTPSRVASPVSLRPPISLMGKF